MSPVASSSHNTAKDPPFVYNGPSRLKYDYIFHVFFRLARLESNTLDLRVIVDIMAFLLQSDRRASLADSCLYTLSVQ